MSVTSLGARLEKAIRTYNKYRSPEVNAELLSVEHDGSQFVVRFTGSFCRTCGFYDYFEDLIYDIIDESNVKTRIGLVKEEWEKRIFDVIYQIEDMSP